MSAIAERLFGDIDRREGDLAQSLLFSTLKMKELIRVLVGIELRDNRLGQSGLLDPKPQAFRGILDMVCVKILKQKSYFLEGLNVIDLEQDLLDY